MPITGEPAYMHHMNIQSGAFDFAVDTDGNWTFLECNEAGQFLFVEDILPQNKVLASFCAWIAGLCGHPLETIPTFTFAEFRDSAECHAATREIEVHKNNQPYMRYVNESPA